MFECIAYRAGATARGDCDSSGSLQIGRLTVIPEGSGRDGDCENQDYYQGKAKAQHDRHFYDSVIIRVLGISEHCVSDGVKRGLS